MQKLDLKNLSKSCLFHFIGADGIGMSGIAKMLWNMGFKVQGSNEQDGENLRDLTKLGMKTFVGHNNQNLHGVDFVVFSSAVDEDNVEMVEAKALNIPIIERAVMLQYVLDTKKSIGVSGTHGKTTTTSFIGTMLNKYNLEPSIINGGIINLYNDNNVIGDGDYIVCEVCEAFGNLKHFTNDIAVITNIDAEHMEFYKTFDNLKNYFREYIQRVPLNGGIVMCREHPVVMELKTEFEGKKQIITYGFDDADVMAKNILWDRDGMVFDIHFKDGEIIDGVKIPLFGRHNVLNAMASVGVAKMLDQDMKKIKEAIAEFHGVKHRFTPVAKIEGVRIFDDYAHHPKEIETTLVMARMVAGNGRVFAIFQPHRYSRLTDLFNEFIEALKIADFVIVMPVYGAGEGPEGFKNHHDLFIKMKESGFENVFEVSEFSEIYPIILSNMKECDIIVSMGAGDIKHHIYELPINLGK